MAKEHLMDLFQLLSELLEQERVRRVFHAPSTVADAELLSQFDVAWSTALESHAAAEIALHEFRQRYGVHEVVSLGSSSGASDDYVTIGQTEILHQNAGLALQSDQIKAIPEISSLSAWERVNDWFRSFFFSEAKNFRSSFWVWLPRQLTEPEQCSLGEKEYADRVLELDSEGDRFPDPAIVLVSDDFLTSGRVSLLDMASSTAKGNVALSTAKVDVLTSTVTDKMLFSAFKSDVASSTLMGDGHFFTAKSGVLFSTVKDDVALSTVNDDVRLSTAKSKMAWSTVKGNVASATVKSDVLFSTAKSDMAWSTVKMDMASSTAKGDG